MTDVVSRSAAVRFSEPLWKLKFQSLLANQPLQCRDPSLVFLVEIGGLCIFVGCALLGLLNPDADKASRHIAFPQRGIPARPEV